MKGNVMTSWNKFLLVMTVFAVSIVAAMITVANSARAWDIDKMNEQIEKTNVIVGGVCSGTIIGKKDRLVLTVVIPANTEAVVHLPGRQARMVSGAGDTPAPGTTTPAGETVFTVPGGRYTFEAVAGAGAW